MRDHPNRTGSPTAVPIVTTTDEDRADRVAEAGAPVPVPPHRCQSPRTTRTFQAGVPPVQRVPLLVLDPLLAEYGIATSEYGNRTSDRGIPTSEQGDFL